MEDFIAYLKELEWRVARLEKVNGLAAGRWEVLTRQTLRTDGFIPAIKKYRELSGAGLLEAKEYVESLRNNL